MGENDSVKKVFVISDSGKPMEIHSVSDIQTHSEPGFYTDEVKKFNLCKNQDLEFQITDKKTIKKIERLCKMTPIESLLAKLLIRKWKKIIKKLKEEFK